MKVLNYTTSAAKDLKRYSNIATRIRNALQAYAADQTAHANNVTKLVGDVSSRMKVGDFRVIFVESPNEILVTRIGPRGGVYD